MVSFICGACQETLKKNKVDAHCRHCRDCWVLSCVDCCKDFHGEEFRTHQSCISEAEKYQGALYRPSGKKQPGSKADPQERWMDSIRRLAGESGHKESVARVLQQISDYDNVPRKRTKFGNFLFNSVQVRDRALIDQLFEIIHAGWMADKPQHDKEAEAKPQGSEKSTDETESPESTQESKPESTPSKETKRKSAPSSEPEDDHESPPTAKKATVCDIATSLPEDKKLKKQIKKLLKSEESKSLKLKELYSKLVSSAAHKDLDRAALKTFVKANSKTFTYSKKEVRLAKNQNVEE